MSFPGRAVQRAWHVVDASTQTVGRLATTIAPLLKGKHKPTYRPNSDCGDFVVIINAEKVSLLYCIFNYNEDWRPAASTYQHTIFKPSFS